MVTNLTYKVYAFFTLINRIFPLKGPWVVNWDFQKFGVCCWMIIKYRGQKKLKFSTDWGLAILL